MTKGLKWKWLIGLGILLASVWITVVPPFQASDESVHFGETMRWGLFLFDGLRGETLNQTCSEFLYPTLEAERVSGLRFNPLSSYAAPLTEGRRSHDYIYDHGCQQFPLLSLAYILFAPFIYLFPSPLAAFYGLRLLSLVFFALTLHLTYRLAQQVFKEENDRLLWLAILILSPLYVLMSVAMSYESLLYLWFAALYWVVGRHVLNAKSSWPLKKQLGVLALLSLLGMFTKIAGVYIPVFALGALILSKRLSTKAYWGAGSLVAVLIGATLMLTNFLPDWWSIFFELQHVNLIDFLYQITLLRWAIVFESFWGGAGFGWLDTHAHPVWIALLFVFSAGGLWGSAKRWWMDRKQWRTENAWLSFCWLTLIGFEALALVYNFPLALDGQIEAMGYVQGRFYYPIMIPLSYLLIVGWKTWITPQKAWAYGRVLIGLGLFAFHFYYLGAVVIPRFYF
jgi:hypothetical protein